MKNIVATIITNAR